ncbi:oligopeptide/dipeptide ABC transporter, ATP-binding protein, C-terminal domain-containing protein [Nocardioides terrae]|uniref:Oligopeptide/dipeptide ABC transporter, ATP-binding protein, C-terminal domain-containing protein n=2 Tax=Nocardioides terrae TaxID=574651 RepID=A0A1I1NVX3_9ACTN|nr:dipeptide/oligopeptide/nickel ABC transporter permease/ATP-binding protein [Nocardioides terrae]SFC97880.1 oligopeptide/dipeptide ABC transporter, ATP-binding protein, C-terminal domain-containing protein [Nocardioides terrae]
MRRWSRVLRTPVGIAGVTMLGLVLLLAVLAPLVWGDHADAVDTDNLLAGPSGQHWIGTDNLGRDLLFRVLVATRLSVALALLATAIGTTLGLLLGVAPLLLGRRVGRLVVAVVNILVAFPGLLLVLFFAVVFGVGTRGAVLAVGVAIAPGFARLVQTFVAGIAERDFVAAARIAGVSRLRIVVRHVLPNIAEPLIVNATITAGGVLLSFAGLSFLGLGVQPPSYDWGRLMQEGLSGIYIHPLAALAPGIAVILAGLAFNLTGEAIAGAFGVSTVTGTADPLPHVPAGETPEGRAAHEGTVRDDLVLDVRDLAVSFPGGVRPVRGVSFGIAAGEALGVVGESGSGKSLTALSIARLVEEPGRVDARRLTFCGTDLLEQADHDELLGTSLAVVFQDPMTSFNPVMRIGTQLAEVGRHHQGLSRRSALARAVDRLAAVRVRDPERRARQYPHEFSGGMRQRAMIGMGLMGSPRLIIADEPTTALDVTVQSQVLELLQGVRREQNAALLLISHDVSVVADVCGRVLVMYAGRIVEDLPTDALRTDARHPYTRALVAAVPDMATALDAPLATIPGQPVDPAHVPAGCAFAARCPIANDRCRTEEPVLRDDGTGHRVACWHTAEEVELLSIGTAGGLDTPSPRGSGYSTTDDGSGYSTTGDGSGYSTTGDGSGYSTTGDGSGYSTTGDGSGYSTTGDGSAGRVASASERIETKAPGEEVAR